MNGPATLRALLGRLVSEGHVVAFTCDGQARPLEIVWADSTR